MPSRSRAIFQEGIVRRYPRRLTLLKATLPTPDFFVATVNRADLTPSCTVLL